MPWKYEKDAVHESWKSWKRQQKPWNKPQGYSVGRRDFQFASATPLTEVASTTAALTNFYPAQRDLDGLRRKAYASFMNSVEPAKSELLTGLAEVNTTFRMVADRVGSLSRAARSLKRGDFGGFLSEIKIPEKARSRRYLNKINPHPRWVSKNASSLWLEYWLGWAPTIGDIYNVCAVSTRNFDVVPVKGHATITPTYVDTRGNPREHGTSLIVRNGLCRCLMGGQVRITNPNILLAKELGLLNPALTAWELVPMSFVINWFVDVGGLLNRFDDWYGLSLDNSYESLKREVNVIGTAWQGNGRGTIVKESANAYLHSLDRSVPLTFPLPVITAGAGISNITRAATSVSLLSQLLRDLSPPGR